MVPEVMMNMKSQGPDRHVPSFEREKRRIKWRRLSAKKWFFPALYLSVASLILSIAWITQGNQLRHPSLKKGKHSIETILPTERVPTNPTDDQFSLPVSQKAQALMVMDFYNEAGLQRDKEANLVQYEHSYWPHPGIDFSRKDGGAFDVLSVLDGKVVRVEENPIIGHQIEIQHESGIRTVYQSLGKSTVSKGESIQTGQIIARSGRNLFEKAAGNHLHFEVRDSKDRVCNPKDYFPEEKLE
jgi:stage II sporulation protein Q